MANMIPGFESLDKIHRNYPYFDLNTRRFSQTKGSRYCGGIPLCYDAEARRLYIDSADTHTLVYGSTGSLKTRSVVSPSIRVLGYAGESMIINDPKGELFARHAGSLKQQGYNIVEINFRDPSLGNSWNPLYIPYQFYMEGNIDKAAGFIQDIANNLMISEKSIKDPFWDYAASDLMYGLILLLFRYCKDYEIPVNAVNIGNLLALRRALFGGRQKPSSMVLWKYASGDEMVAARLSGSIYAPEDTKNSILSVFDQKVSAFMIQPALLDMLANNDFDIADIGRVKTAVFLIAPDEKTSYHRLISMFIKESYEYLLDRAEQTREKRVENRIHYILDEFSSLPPIADMPSMISAARSRDIRFLLVAQSQASLRQRYGDEAETIVSNCLNWIFFTSRELGLLRELSELCGVQKNHMPNISVYDLQHLSKERREALVLAGRLRPARVNMIDIDQFGDRSYTVLEHERRERLARERLAFTLYEEEKGRYTPYKTNNPLKEGSPLSNRKVLQDVDEMLRMIDGRIVELKSEEAEAKRNHGQKGEQS